MGPAQPKRNAPDSVPHSSCGDDTRNSSPSHNHRSGQAPVSPDRDVCVCVVGVGFVGESLLKEFGRVFPCVGFDISQKRIADLERIFASFENVSLTSDEVILARGTHFLISVPTLLRSDRSVNLDHVQSAAHTVFKYARPGSTVVIESSVSVGTTRRLLGPYQNIFHCGMSPERVDPGRVEPAVHEVPKIVSGLTSASLKAIQSIYGQAFSQVVPVSKPEVAEMTKLFENCYRMVNIAYVNEISDACRSHGIDPKEMIGAAATKPYGYQPFWPGLGVGGHCIPINPFYLFATNRNLPVLDKATKSMQGRPSRMARNFHRKVLAGSQVLRRSGGVNMPRILVVGVGFKPGQATLSCSPSIVFSKTIRALGCSRLVFHDPLVSQEQIPWMEKLREKNWKVDYLESEFDGVAVCCHQMTIDMSVVSRLRKTFVRVFD